jgi:hypothetical protein
VTDTTAEPVAAGSGAVVPAVTPARPSRAIAAEDRICFVCGRKGAECLGSARSWRRCPHLASEHRNSDIVAAFAAGALLHLPKHLSTRLATELKLAVNHVCQQRDVADVSDARDLVDDLPAVEWTGGDEFAGASSGPGVFFAGAARHRGDYAQTPAPTCDELYGARKPPGWRWRSRHRRQGSAARARPAGAMQAFPVLRRFVAHAAAGGGGPNR